MKLTEIKKTVSESVNYQMILPDSIRKMIREDLNESQKDKFREIVINAITKTVDDEISAEYDIWRDW